MLNLQAHPQLSHVTPVKINIHKLELEDKEFFPRGYKYRFGKIVKRDLKEMIRSVKDANYDQAIFRNVKGYHISGNHRWAVKEGMRNSSLEAEQKEYLENSYWNCTLAQIVVGLSPGQARYLASLDNKKENVSLNDSNSSVIQVKFIMIEFVLTIEP